jgi:hypothetical protein
MFAVILKGDKMYNVRVWTALNMSAQVIIKFVLKKVIIRLMCKVKCVMLKVGKWSCLSYANLKVDDTTNDVKMDGRSNARYHGLVLS